MEDEALALAEGYDFFHADRIGLVFVGHKVACFWEAELSRVNQRKQGRGKGCPQRFTAESAKAALFLSFLEMGLIFRQNRFELRKLVEGCLKAGDEADELFSRKNLSFEVAGDGPFVEADSGLLPAGDFLF